MKEIHPNSIPAVAKRVGVCRATIYNEIARGKLKRTKIGSRSIIQPEHEKEWLEACAEEVEQQQERIAAGELGGE